MEPFQQRVVEEHKALGEKLNKLEAFSGSEAFARLPQDERQRLSRQHSYMAAYHNILQDRIDAFNGKEVAERSAPSIEVVSVLGVTRLSVSDGTHSIALTISKEGAGNLAAELAAAYEEAEE